MKWFRGSYIQINKTWYSGALARTPKTNNVVESFNRYMKQFQTHYNRKGTNVFMRNALDIVRQRSVEYVRDKTAPISTIDYATNKQLMKKTQEYSKLKKTIATEKSGFGTKFYIFGGENNEKISMEAVNKWKKRQCTTFEDFKKTLHHIHQIHFVGSRNDINEAVCTCPDFGKHYCCKHVALVATRMGLLVPPDDLLQEPVAAPNPRGRPRKATKALIKD